MVRLPKDRGESVAETASEVPEPGDMKPVEVAGQPLILVRGNDREVRVLHNVCPHRGARALIEAGSGPALTCPYHAWSYELDGSLKGCPHYIGVSPTGEHGHLLSTLRD
jgi:choline monooxygenase